MIAGRILALRLRLKLSLLILLYFYINYVGNLTKYFLLFLLWSSCMLKKSKSLQKFSYMQWYRQYLFFKVRIFFMHEVYLLIEFYILLMYEVSLKWGQCVRICIWVYLNWINRLMLLQDLPVKFFDFISQYLILQEDKEKLRLVRHLL